MKAKTVILKLLIQDSRLRDSDNKLIARFWHNEMSGKGMNPSEMSAYEMLCVFAEMLNVFVYLGFIYYISCIYIIYINFYY